MADKEEKEWRPPSEITELYKLTAGNVFAAINSPKSGARSPDAVPLGTASFQLYSLATPNGQKAGILLEELGIDYDAHTINIGRGMQFYKGFVAINPNSKIPAAVDLSLDKPVNLFESGSIMLYLADKYNKFIPQDWETRAQCINWMNWAQVQGIRKLKQQAISITRPPRLQ